jgi:hypothetical protein
MKLKGASLLELSLAIGFAIVVFTTSLHLVQEATERVNKALRFQTFQLTGVQGLWHMSLSQPWAFMGATASSVLLDQDVTLFEGTSLTLDRYLYNSGIWSTTASLTEVHKLTLSHTDFSQTLFVFQAPHQSLGYLRSTLGLLQVALMEYYKVYGGYPATQSLQTLISTGLLPSLPNNPYTQEDTSNTNTRNLTDWYYSNTGGVRSIYAYTHPDLIFSW